MTFGEREGPCRGLGSITTLAAATYSCLLPPGLCICPCRHEDGFLEASYLEALAGLEEQVKEVTLACWAGMDESFAEALGYALGEGVERLNLYRCQMELSFLKDIPHCLPNLQWLTLGKSGKSHKSRCLACHRSPVTSAAWHVAQATRISRIQSPGSS